MHKKEMNFAFFYVSCASLWPFNDSFAPIRVLLRFKPLFKDKPLLVLVLSFREITGGENENEERERERFLTG
jgi:hypothetical protein